MLTFISKRPNDIVSLIIGNYCTRQCIHTTTIYWKNGKTDVHNLYKDEIYSMLLKMGFTNRDIEICHFIPKRKYYCC